MAHYSDSHKGFLVGFNQEKLLDAIRSISDMALGTKSAAPTPGLEIRPVQVNYPKKMPVLVPERGNEGTLVRRIVTTKHRAWKYENEVRYLLNKYDKDIRLARLSDEERVVKFPLDVISEVTLGVNASLSDLQKVADILSDGRPRVRLFRASPSFGRYDLDRQEIDY